MPIFGLTVGEQGEVIQRLAVTTKVAIGQVVQRNGKSYPQKLDHFVFLRKSAKTFDWEPDPELMQKYGLECREFWIILLDDDQENVFRTEYAWWTKTEKVCWGDGRQATRRTKEQPDGQSWTPCGDDCPDLEAGSCKPSGDLYFVLADYPRLGSVCRLHTSSYRSIRQVHSAIEQIRTVTGGRLAGIRAKLVVRPEKATFIDKDKSKKTTTIYALNLELAAEDMRKLLGEMTQYAKLFEQTQKLLGTGRNVEYAEEPEVDRAPDVAQEFYPAEEIQPAAAPVQQPARASAPVPAAQPANGAAAAFITTEQRRKFFEVCMEAGWGTDQIKQILSERWGIASTTQIPAEQFEEICGRFATGQMDDEPYKASDSDIPF
jgi:Recombination directionality factor-like